MKKSSLLLGAFMTLAITVTSVSAMAPNPFTDVPKDHWAYQAIEDGRTSGLWEGYKDGSFGVGKNITREEVAMAMYRNNQMMMTKMAEMQKAMEEKMAAMEKKMGEMEKMMDPDYFPIDNSPLADGEMSYMVCKSEKDSSRIYTTVFPQPPFEGKQYDKNGDLIDPSVETKDCFRTTQEFYDSKVND